MGRSEARIRRVGEVDQTVRTGHNVVGTVQPLTLEGLDDGRDLGAVGPHARDAAAVLLAEDDVAVREERLAVGRARVLANHVRLRIARVQPVGALGLDVLEEQAAVAEPERPLGELETAGQTLQFGVRFQQGREPQSRNTGTMRSPPSTGGWLTARRLGLDPAWFPPAELPPQAERSWV